MGDVDDETDPLPLSSSSASRPRHAPDVAVIATSFAADYSLDESDTDVRDSYADGDDHRSLTISDETSRRDQVRIWN